MALLVPRQLRMTGMTGDVPYYGGRMTPAQAYATSHRQPPASPAPPPPPPPAPAKAAPHEDPRVALDRLLASGVLSQEEHDDLSARLEERS